MVGGNGQDYTVDTDAAITFDNPLLVLTDIQTDLSRKIVSVYDVPPKAVKGGHPAGQGSVLGLQGNDRPRAVLERESGGHRSA
jgi:hypothetical protein